MLTMDPVVRVNVSVELTTTVQSVFDVGAIVGPSNVLNVTTRYAAYASLAEMLEAGFTASMPEYIAAQKYFGVSPAPASVVIIHYDTDPEAEAYSSSATYSVGDLVTHNGSIYQCITAIAEAEEWTEAHWSLIPPTSDSPSIAVMDAVEKGAEFYGVFYCPKSGETSANIKANLISIDGYLNSRSFGALFYGVTGSVSEIISQDGILSTFLASGTRRSFEFTCTNDVNDAAGMMGVAMGYARTHTSSAFALSYKSIASATANNFTESQVSQIKEKNGNVYVTRTKGRASLENGASASGLRYDEVLYMDMIAADLQVACFNLIANTDIKLPQNDSTTTLFKSVISRVLEGYYGRGVLSTAEWRGLPIVNIATGDTIEHGYHIWADRYDNQTNEDRVAHKAMPMTILLCLSGSVESIVLNLQVQR